MRKSSGGDVRTPKSGGGKVVRKKVTRFTENNKENFNIYGVSGVPNQKKSPLPVGYPRMPLQDITAVLQSMNNNSEGEEPSTGMRTRSQGSSRNLPKKPLSSMNNTTGGGQSKPRKKQTVHIHEEMNTTTFTGDSVQMSEQTIHFTIELSSPVQLKEQGSGGEQKINLVPSPAERQLSETADAGGSALSGSVDAADKENVVHTLCQREKPERRALLEKPNESSSRSVPDSGTRYQDSQEQKRRKPLSSRSRVSGFR